MTLEKLEEENKVGVLLLGRPYHLDPGLNHSVLDEYQALGYPVLSIRSIPKDPKWLARFYKDDLEREFVDSPLSVSDVWPENYSTNSVQKVWAAKFAARHPNVVVLDLSMPRMSGEEVLAQLRASDPHLKVLVLSGHSVSSEQFAGQAEVLKKPLSIKALAHKVREILDQ